jgi:hypothetical protein
MKRRYVNNIMKVYEQATADEISHGMQWYSLAQQNARAIADHNEIPLRVAVGVIAALSPTNEWNQNLIDASNFCKTFVDGGYYEDVKASTYKKMWEKAWKILSTVPQSDNEVLAILNGPKISDFFLCILGYDVCVIDGHAWCIANADRRRMQEVPNIGKKARLELQEAYARAAKKAGIKPYQMQAITWVAWKRIHNV